MSKQTSIVITNLIGLYQLAVGLIGLLLLLYVAYQTFAINFFFVLYYVIMSSMLAFCSYAGYKCLTKPAFGLELTLYNQLFQFAWFILFGFQYTYSAGLGLFVGVSISDGTDFLMKFRWFGIRMGKANPEVKLFAVNLIPIAITFLLEPLSNALKKDD